MKTIKIKDWVAALRSGDYSQCAGALCRADDITATVSYCCLGVAAKAADALDLGRIYVDSPVDETPRILNLDLGLPEITTPAHTLEEAAVRWDNYKGDVLDSFQKYLVDMNDNGASFSDIADEIEKYCDPEAEIQFLEKSDF